MKEHSTAAERFAYGGMIDADQEKRMLAARAIGWTPDQHWHECPVGPRTSPCDYHGCWVHDIPQTDDPSRRPPADDLEAAERVAEVVDGYEFEDDARAAADTIRALTAELRAVRGACTPFQVNDYDALARLPLGTVVIAPLVGTIVRSAPPPYMAAHAHFTRVGSAGVHEYWGDDLAGPVTVLWRPPS